MKMKYCLLAIITLSISILLAACKKEKGERGLTGSGVDFKRYEGAFTTPSFEFDAPDLTVESFFQVRVSSNAVNWEDAFCGGDYVAKRLSCFTLLDSGDYRAILQNPT